MLKPARIVSVLMIVAASIAASTGTASAGSATMYPELFDFNYVAIGSQSSSKDFTIKNLGDNSVALGEVSLTGKNPEHYYVYSENCSARKLAPHASCAVSVRFRPMASGTFIASLEVERVSGGMNFRSFFMGTAPRTGQGPPMGTNSSAACRKVTKALATARKKVRLTRGKLRLAKTQKVRRVLRERLISQQRKVLRTAVLVNRRCD